MNLEKLRNRTVPLLAAGLFILLTVWVALAPAEASLGNLVKLVYVHGALVWVGLLTFSIAGVLGLAALFVRHLLGLRERALTWYHGTQAAGTTAIIIWIIYVISAMAVTGLTWGQLIAWNEPRVRASALILFAALLLFVVSKLVNHPDFTAVVNLLMGIVTWVVVRQADAIRHPANPIGGSQSTAIQSFYLLIVLTIGGLAATLVAWIWTGAELKGSPEGPDQAGT
jgi:predicted nucleic acid-binding Zn ribbon protein